MIKVVNLKKEILWSAIQRIEGKPGSIVTALPQQDNGTLWIKNDNIQKTKSQK